MDNLPHGRVIGIDVSRDWLDVHCLPDGHRCRVANAPAGYAAVVGLARDLDAVVCFESTGGQEWQLWALLETEGVAARQVPPAQVKAFAQSRGRPQSSGRKAMPSQSFDEQESAVGRDAQTAARPNPRASEARHRYDVRRRRHRTEATDRRPDQGTGRPDRLGHRER